MKKPSKAVEKICIVSRKHFANHGYIGTSLNEIAQEVGIKKSSLYSHFINKNDLFITVFNEAVRNEISFIEQCFEEEQTLHSYINNISKHFLDSENLKLLLTTAYFSPKNIHQLIEQAYISYLNKLRSYIEVFLVNEYKVDHSCLMLYVNAYLGIIDSLHIELIYSGSTDFESRKLAFLKIFEDALAFKQQGDSGLVK